MLSCKTSISLDLVAPINQLLFELLICQVLSFENNFITTYPSLFRLYVIYVMCVRIGSVLNPLAGKFFEDTRKKGKGAKTRASHDLRSFYLSQYYWLKGSHMSKVVWLPNENDYLYCEFVAPNTRQILAKCETKLILASSVINILLVKWLQQIFIWYVNVLGRQVIRFLEGRWVGACWVYVLGYITRIMNVALYYVRLK